MPQHILYNVGDRMEPCGTPACISLVVDISPLTKTLNFLREIKELINLIRLNENFNSDNLHSNPRRHFVSKRFSTSKNTAVINILFLKFNVKSISLIH
jgi:hypothetical protein